MTSKFVEYKPNGLLRISAMLEAFRKLKTKPKTCAELKEALQVIWGNLPQEPIDKAVKDFSNKATLTLLVRLTLFLIKNCSCNF